MRGDSAGEGSGRGVRDAVRDLVAGFVDGRLIASLWAMCADLASGMYKRKPMRTGGPMGREWSASQWDTEWCRE